MIKRAVSGRFIRRKSKIAVCHPRLSWGGSEKKVLWTIEALKHIYDVTLVTSGPVHYNYLNRYYGTALQPGDFHVIQVPLPFFLNKDSFAAGLQGALYKRFCRRLAPDFDVMISGYGPCDFGRPGIHYIADFSWSTKIRNKFHPTPQNWYYKIPIWKNSYNWLINKIEGKSERLLSPSEDIFVSVSPWVSKLLYATYGTTSTTIYSPIIGQFAKVPWSKKDFGFVCLGRISPEKRIEHAIEILTLVRRKGYPLHLHIIGGIENNSYHRFIKKLCEKNSSWIFLEGRLFESEKLQLLVSHRYGLHTCYGDAFPGAVVEMIKSGCIPFVAREGGQVDAVGHPALVFNDTLDAENKIENVLKRPDLQNKLRVHLIKQSELYSVEVFISKIKSLVRKYL